MPDNYLTTREAAQQLGVSLRTIQLWVERGRLKAWKTEGGHRRIAQREVELLLREATETAAEGNRKQPLPVLIIEDNETLLKLYRAQMATWPFAVDISTAPNGYEGLVMIGEVVPRLLICDLRLPGVNGFQIVRTITEIERFKDIPIVVVSGMSTDEIDAHGGLPTNVELMEKPIDFARLKDIAYAVWQQQSVQSNETEK